MSIYNKVDKEFTAATITCLCIKICVAYLPHHSLSLSLPCSLLPPPETLSFSTILYHSISHSYVPTFHTINTLSICYTLSVSLGLHPLYPMTLHPVLWLSIPLSGIYHITTLLLSYPCISTFPTCITSPICTYIKTHIFLLASNGILISNKQLTVPPCREQETAEADKAEAVA